MMFTATRGTVRPGSQLHGGSNLRVHIASLRNNVTRFTDRVPHLPIGALAIDHVERAVRSDESGRSFLDHEVVGRHSPMLQVWEHRVSISPRDASVPAPRRWNNAGNLQTGQLCRRGDNPTRGQRGLHLAPDATLSFQHSPLVFRSLVLSPRNRRLHRRVRRRLTLGTRQA